MPWRDCPQPKSNGGLMLAYIPVRFDVFRPIRRHLRWTLQCLIGFTNQAGQCFPSVRKLAEVAEIGKSTAARHLAELERTGVLKRARRRGRGFVYTIDSAFLPASKAMSHSRAARVPPGRTEENPKKQSSDSPNWEARLRRFREQGLWVARFGPRPGEPGCMVPPGLLMGQRGDAVTAG